MVTKNQVKLLDFKLSIKTGSLSPFVFLYLICTNENNYNYNYLRTFTNVIKLINGG